MWRSGRSFVGTAQGLMLAMDCRSGRGNPVCELVQMCVD